MQILIIRHAIAEDRLTFATTHQHDDLRPLTPEGKARMQRGAQGLGQLLPKIDVLVSSPLTRAVQTADIVHAGYPQTERQQWDELAPDADPKRVADRLKQLPSEAIVALVGHEPDLSDLIAWLTTGKWQGFMHLKKGSACLLESQGAPRSGSATLMWALAPRQLRGLGGL